MIPDEPVYMHVCNCRCAPAAKCAQDRLVRGMAGITGRTTEELATCVTCPCICHNDPRSHIVLHESVKLTGRWR